MKSAFLIIIFTVSAVSGQALKKINGIEGSTEIIEFDSNGNAYIISSNNSSLQLHKLSSAKEILWTSNLTVEVLKILINSQDNVYLKFRSDFNYVGILNETNLEIVQIDQLFSMVIKSDEEGNVYYNGLKGINLIRPGSTDPILIDYFKDYFIINENTFAVDNNGNVYFGVITHPSSSPWDRKSSFAVLTKEAKEQDPPTAKHDFLTYRDVDDLIVDDNDDVWIYTSDGVTSSLDKFSNGSREYLFQEQYPGHFGKAARDRIYVLTFSGQQLEAPTYFLTLDGQSTFIPNLKHVSASSRPLNKIVTDSEGNTYLNFYHTYNEGDTVGVVVVKQNETMATRISFVNDDLIYVRNIILDKNDDLWVDAEGQGIHRVRKGEITAVKIETPPELVDKDVTGIYINKETNEIFVLCKKGLYFVENASV